MCDEKYYKYTNITEVIVIKIQTSYSIICFSPNYIPRKIAMAWIHPKNWFCTHSQSRQEKGTCPLPSVTVQLSWSHWRAEGEEAEHVSFLLLGASPQWYETQSYHVENIFLVFSRTGQKQKQYILNEVILWIMLTVETYKQSQNATAELNITAS